MKRRGRAATEIPVFPVVDASQLDKPFSVAELKQLRAEANARFERLLADARRREQRMVS